MDDYKKRRKQIEEIVEGRFELEGRALQIVERLTETTVDEELCRDCAKFLLQSHYADVVEERSIDMMCGYPLCNKKLEKMPSQKYHISMKTNKVYDMTERKCFCSQFCYRASKYYQAQIPTSPLWSRTKEKFGKIELLEADQKPLAGDDSMIVRLRLEEGEIEKPPKPRETIEDADELIDDLSILSLHDSRTQKERFHEFEKNEVKDEYKRKQKEVSRPVIKKASNEIDGMALSQVDHLDMENIEISKPKTPNKLGQKHETNFHENGHSHEKIISQSNNKIDDFNMPCNIVTNTEKIRDDEISEQKQGRVKPVGEKKGLGGLVIFQCVIKCLLQWRTDDSLTYLNNLKETKVKSEKRDGTPLGNRLSDDLSALKEGNKERDGNDIHSDMNKAMMDNEILSVQEAESGNVGEVVSYAASKPVPSLDKLKEETEFFSLKVRQFYSLRPDKLQPSVEVKEKQLKKSGGEKVEGLSRYISLPPVDSKSQVLIRRKILLNKVHKVLRDILPFLEMSLQDISSDMNGLIMTFDPCSHNISFKPAGWTLVALCLLHLLAIRQPHIQARLASTGVQGFLTTALKQYGITHREMNSLVKQFMEKSGKLT